jgi:polysaccharide biosynthesis/export protein
MRNALLVLAVAVILFSSCVPNRKIVLLQKDDLKNRKDILRDTVLRRHKLNVVEYKVQPLDNLLINFETLSGEGDTFDFLNKITARANNGGGGGNMNSNAALNGILVNAEGNIEFPVLGSVHVSGLTLFQVQDSVRALASRYIPDVVVRVRMLNFRFTILGEVNGEKVVNSFNTRLTMSEAIGLAGGLTELADRSLVKVIRQKGSETEVFYVDLLKEEFMESPHYFVQQNDVIIVPPLKQRTFRRYFAGNLGLVTSVISFVVLIVTLSQ